MEATTQTCNKEHLEFADLPDEIISHVLSFLDIPDLLCMSRTSRRYRRLSLDPVLHTIRLRHSTHRLSCSLSLPQRPSLSSLAPPVNTIILNRSHVIARSISRQLISIRLNRNLSRRPEVTFLVEKNVLPRECCGRGEGGEKIWLGGKGVVSPGLIETKRKVEREQVKDGLRVGLERKWEVVERQRKRGWLEEHKDVRELIRRFTAKAGWKEEPTSKSVSQAGSAIEASDTRSKPRTRLWGEARAKWKDGPPRAHVLGLRKFWEGIAHGAQALRV